MQHKIEEAGQALLIAARDSQRLSGVNILRADSEMYYLDYDSYPSSLEQLISNKKYISELPEDPLDKKSYFYITLPLGCQGVKTSPCTSYHIGANLENRDNKALSLDADADSSSTPGGFDGSDSHACIPSSLATRFCYDVSLQQQ